MNTGVYTLIQVLYTLLIQVSTAGLPNENPSEMQISLSYNDSNQRLTIGVFAGKNFTCKLSSSAGKLFYDL